MNGDVACWNWIECGIDRKTMTVWVEPRGGVQSSAQGVHEEESMILRVGVRWFFETSHPRKDKGICVGSWALVDFRWLFLDPNDWNWRLLCLKSLRNKRRERRGCGSTLTRSDSPWYLLASNVGLSELLNQGRRGSLHFRNCDLLHRLVEKSTRSPPPLFESPKHQTILIRSYWNPRGYNSRVWKSATGKQILFEEENTILNDFLVMSNSRVNSRTQSYSRLALLTHHISGRAVMLDTSLYYWIYLARMQVHKIEVVKLENGE